MFTNEACLFYFLARDFPLIFAIPAHSACFLSYHLPILFQLNKGKIINFFYYLAIQNKISLALAGAFTGILYAISYLLVQVR